MFQRIVELCRHLARGGPRPTPDGGAGAAEAERRVWVRHPSTAEAVVQPVNGAVSRQSARVRNVSRGGINLVVTEPLEPGDLIGVELPGGGTQSVTTVLACVVHVRGEGPGEWGIGCSFAEELSGDVLSAFGARREKPARPEDNRGWVRFACGVRAVCRRVGPGGEEPWPARVTDISPGGIGLLVDQAVETGALLQVYLEGPKHAGRTILACVVHVVAKPGSERALGCNFIRELSEADLAALL